MTSILVLVAAFMVGAMLLVYKPLAGSSTWRATVTPLASIMGSGFLVCAPLLYDNVGNYAVIAMGGLLLLAYGVGSVMRFNIRYGEPLLEKLEPELDVQREEHRLHNGHRNASLKVAAEEAIDLLERGSHLALTCAYCISISYYLQLLSSFALASTHTGTWVGKILCTLILAGIGAMGALRGLKGLERVERYVVSANIAMIAALIAGLIHYNLAAAGQAAWQLHALPVPADKLHSARLLMGMLIVVQGFETSRYLGSEHSRQERVRTMRWAQLISSAIYISFIALMAIVINQHGHAGQAGITAIVGYCVHIAPILPILVTVTAIGSQFSAAAADDAGCSGLLESFIRRPGRININYLAVSVASIAVTWVTDVYQIISVASRAFSVYYTIQCVIALLVLRRTPEATSPRLKAALYGLLAVICASIALFGVSAE